MKQTVLITGASGLLGKYLVSYFAKQFKVVALYNQTSLPTTGGVITEKVDLTNPLAVKNVLSLYKPQIIIHTAGLTSVDLCESNPALAQALNVGTTASLVNNISAPHTRFIHISTDHLFAGSSSYYTEDSPVCPLNTYAITKYEAEQEAARFEDALILRTNFYGGHSEKKKSFSAWVYDELKSGRTINMFDDVFYSPISIPTLVENVDLMIQHDLSGLYNVVGSERICKYSFAHKLARICNLDASLIHKAKLSDAHLTAPRPHDMSLSIEKILLDMPDFLKEDVDSGLRKILDLNMMY